MKHSAFHPEKMYTYLRGYASALGMKDTLKALSFARETIIPNPAICHILEELILPEAK